MGDGCEGVVEEHAGSGIAHDDADLFAHIGFVAMDGAVDAEGFGCYEGAMVGTVVCVVE